VSSRRDFLRRAALGVGATVAASRLSAQQPSQAPVLSDTSNLFADMDPTAVRPVRLPPKPGAQPSMSDEQRDALEHRIKCQCGCTLDVFTCRTTDFTCQVSPAMHRDVIALVEGGYSAPEILDAFVNVYGERALMAPPKQGFNILGYVLPGIAVGVTGIVIALVLRRWRERAVAAPSPATHGIDATPEELERLEAAIRDDS
jgi:cytochrome c-type biogenesis protein CcmH